MKKIALLTAIIMSLLAFSFVLANEDDNVLLIAPAEEVTEGNIDGEEIPGEIEENPDVDIATPDEDIQVISAPVETDDISTTTVETDTTDTTEAKSNSTIIGAIIAIVIVVVVVALAALVQKK